MKPKVLVMKNKCNGCGLCINLCPGEVFKLVNDKAHVVNEGNCILCYGCVVLCELKAITIEDSDP